MIKYWPPRFWHNNPAHKFVAFVVFCVAIIFAVPLTAHALAIQTVTSTRGIQAWLVQDKTTPVVALHFAFRGGVEQDTPATQGLSSLMADLLTEGAGKNDAAAFQQALADNAISFGLEAGRDAINGALYTLTRNLPIAARLAHDALIAPRFDDSAIARLKQQSLGRIKSQLAEPEWQARRALLTHIFSNHPYALRSLGTATTLTAITRAQLHTEHNRRLAKDNLLVAVVGDITPKILATTLDTIFADLPAHAQLTPVPAIAAPAVGQTIYLPQDSGQSLLLFAAPAIQRNDPDWHAASLLNYSLGGGGFASRLMNEVRDQRGLTYGISTSLSPMAATGIITGDARTANDKAGEAWDVTRDVWEKVWREGITETELAAAKQYLIGALPTGFTSSGAIASMLVGLQKDNLPIDYLDRRAELLIAVTMADIQRVAQRLFDPAKLTLVITGKPENMKSDKTQEFITE